jgi:RNA polymerase sigma-70 factor (ECF subfamily)
MNGRAEEVDRELIRYCLAVTGSAGEAEDLAQEAWLKGFESGAIGSHPNPKALLMRLARQKWIDRVRRERNYARILARMAREAAEAAVADGRDSGGGPAADLEAMLASVVRQLLPLQRTVFLLRDVLGYSAADTARLLHTTEGAVKSALFRARQALRRVRDELRQTERPAAEERGQSDDAVHALVRALAAALRRADAHVIAALAQTDAAQATAALQMLVQHQQARADLRRRRTRQPQARAAA